VLLDEEGGVAGEFFSSAPLRTGTLAVVPLNAIVKEELSIFIILPFGSSP
jgi:hypothetical protein